MSASTTRSTSSPGRRPRERLGEKASKLWGPTIQDKHYPNCCSHAASPQQLRTHAATQPSLRDLLDKCIEHRSSVRCINVTAALHRCGKRPAYRRRHLLVARPLKPASQGATARASSDSACDAKPLRGASRALENVRHVELETSKRGDSARCRSQAIGRSDAGQRKRWPAHRSPCWKRDSVPAFLLSPHVPGFHHCSIASSAAFFRQ